jgi:hypothetical protein
MGNSLNVDQVSVESVLRIVYRDLDHAVGWAAWYGDKRFGTCVSTLHTRDHVDGA